MTREIPAAKGGIVGEKCCPVILLKWWLPHHLGIFYMPQISSFHLLQLLLLLCWDQALLIYTKWKSKNLWIFYHKGHCCPSANKSNSAVWVGTWKHLRNAIVRAVKEWGLDSPSAFVPVATTHRKYLLWSGIQFFVNKPTYYGLVLCTVPLTEPFHTLTIAAISPNLPPHFFWPSYTS
jgi:hypothetical protein